MKNLKIKHKLTIGFAVIALLIFCIQVFSVSGMISINAQNKMFMEKTLPNTDAVWSMRRDMISAQRYLLLALAEDDINLIEENLAKADEDAQNVTYTFELYKKNYRVSEKLVNEFAETAFAMSEPRNKISELLRKNNNESNKAAANIYVNEYKPALDKAAEILKQIDSEQIILSDKQYEKADKTFKGSAITVFLIFLFSIVIMAYIVTKIMRAIITPLNKIRLAVEDLANGDFSSELEYDSNDEFGITCKLIKESFNELKQDITAISKYMDLISNGDLSFKTEKTFKGELSYIETSIDNLVDNMNRSFNTIMISSSEINSSAEQVSAGAQSLAQGSTEQASSIEELSATIAEITDQVNSNSENAIDAKNISKQTGESMQNALADMNEMVSSINNISDTAENIEKIIKVINDIAFQTNILALNAAVEAARAGEAGKGFAVVADEVRNLAGKSADAAKETTNLIEESINAVNDGQDVAKRAFEKFESVVLQTEKVVNKISDIAEQSEKQANNISQIAIGIDQISAVVQTNSATSEESAATAEELTSQANILYNTMQQFKLLS